MRVNLTSPVLHRPSFERALANGAHFADASFGALVLIVCAIGSRFVYDKRVTLEGAPSHSAGWRWFSQVQMTPRGLLAPPSLHDLQLYCVSCPSDSANYIPIADACDSYLQRFFRGPPRSRLAGASSGLVSVSRRMSARTARRCIARPQVCTTSSGSAHFGALAYSPSSPQGTNSAQGARHL
jgi:hypothetical protein